MIDPATQTLTGLPEESTDPALRTARRTFYQGLLSLVPGNPTDDLRRLCEEWRKFTGARWVWLWLFHPGTNGDTGHWELSAVDAPGAIDSYVLKNLTPEDGRATVAELAYKLGHPIFVDDLATWTRTHQGQAHRVVCIEELTGMQCKSLLCVPLIPAPAGGLAERGPTARFSRPLKAAICAHFDGPPPAAMEGLVSLGLMGQLSARFLSSVYDAEHHRIIAAMNSMAGEFLTRKSKRRPADDRREYLDHVIALICERLRVEYVSVFYRNEAKKLIACVATNSLYDAGGQPLMDDESLYRNATYGPKDGLTGRVFKTGKPYFHRIGEPPHRPHYRYRETPLDTPETELAWVIYPIYAPPRYPEGHEPREVLGVIRCVGNRADFIKGKMRNLDPLQIQTLDFIARLLAPVLETMASNIERERIISIIKHDLFAPLNMARDLVKRGARRIESGQPLDPYFIPNLQFCIHTARSLAAGLDQAPSEVREFHPKATKMEANIVAGIKTMLTPHAMIENNMRIQTGVFAGVFPEWIKIDRDQITRAICNLVINAVKYGAHGSTIFLLARADDSGCQLLVQNKGEPIPEEDHQRIFEEGFRSERAVATKFGLGMGLPIARAIMEKHGGTLRLVASGETTVFSLFFPSHLECSPPA